MRLYLGVPISVNQRTYSGSTYITVYTDVPSNEDSQYATGSRNFFNITCSKNTETKEGFPIFIPIDSIFTISQEELRQETGWFISQVELSDIRFEETLNGTNLIQFRH